MASRGLPSEANPAVIQVPMLAPKRRAMPALRDNSPWLARTMTMPVVAEELWTRPVKMAAKRMARRGEERFTISDATVEMLSDFHAEVCKHLDEAIRSLVDRDPGIAAEVTGAKPEIEALSAEADQHLAKRLVAGEPNRLIAFRLESEIIEYLKRIFYFAKRIAKLAVQDDSQTPASQSETTED